MEESDFGVAVDKFFGKDDESTFIKGMLDLMVYVVGILGPGIVLPQVYDMWVLGEFSQEFAFSWAIFALFSPFWILYGIIHKKTPIIVTYSLWFLVGIVIFIGSFIFG
jgi:hypothetical protein